jgi:hypothetical protein
LYFFLTVFVYFEDKHPLTIFDSLHSRRIAAIAPIYAWAHLVAILVLRIPIVIAHSAISREYAVGCFTVFFLFCITNGLQLYTKINDTYNIGTSGVLNSLTCPLNCVGAWTLWSACTATCGGGQQQRTFVITQDATFTGFLCATANMTTISQPCNTTPCPGECAEAGNINRNQLYLSVVRASSATMAANVPDQYSHDPAHVRPVIPARRVTMM